MKTCAVASCGNDSVKRPDLHYFKLPKHTSIREEWIEILSVNPACTYNVFVCEMHFMPKDFRAGRKKELKVHSVPVLLLGPGKSDLVDSEDEFMQCDDEVQEIIELTTPIQTKNVDSKQKSVEEDSAQQTPQSDTEGESGRRPSRRAALVAAKKIFNTVCHGGLRDDPVKLYDNVNAVTKPSTTPRPSPALKRKKKSSDFIFVNDDVDLGLDVDIECKEEELSDIQKQFLMIAEHRYNMVMKNLRELQACNVKIIKNETPYDPSVPVKEIYIASPARVANTCEMIAKPEPAKIVPVKLTRAM